METFAVRSCLFDVEPRPAADQFVDIPGYKAGALPWEVSEDGIVIVFRNYGHPGTTFLKVKSSAMKSSEHGYIGWKAERGTATGALDSVTESGADTIVLIQTAYRGKATLRITSESWNDQSSLVMALCKHGFINTRTVVSEGIAILSRNHGIAALREGGHHKQNVMMRTALGVLPAIDGIEESDPAASNLPGTRASGEEPMAASALASAGASTAASSGSEPPAKRIRIEDHPLFLALQQEKLLLEEDLNEKRRQMSMVMVERESARTEVVRLQALVNELRQT